MGFGFEYTCPVGCGISTNAFEHAIAVMQGLTVKRTMRFTGLEPLSVEVEDGVSPRCLFEFQGLLVQSASGDTRSADKNPGGIGIGDLPKNI